MVLNTKRPGKKKARWVADGSKRPPGSDDAENSLPTCRASTVLLALAMAAEYRWSMAQYDVVGAYLLCDARKVYYVYFPPGFYA